jgi:hypothetical protein
VPPKEGYRPVNILAAEGQLAISFFKRPEKDSSSPMLTSMYEVIDPSSGEILRVYQPAAELGNNLVCFSKDGFTFMKYEHRRVKLLIAKP